MRPVLVEIPTDDGPVFVNPREVKVVKPPPHTMAIKAQGSIIYLKGKGPQGSESVCSTLTPEDAAKVINGGG